MNKLLGGLSVLLGIALVGAVAVVGLAVNRPVKVDVNVAPPLGVVSGNEFDQGIRVSAFESKDGTIANTANTVLTAREVCENNLIPLVYTTGTQSVTLPSAPLLTAQCFDRPEAMRTIWLQNASSASNSAIQVLAGASSSLYTSNLASSTQANVAGGAGGLGNATSTITNGGLARLVGIRITSSTPWILWAFELFR